MSKPLPTLLVAGSFKNSPDETPLEYIQRWIRQRMTHAASMANRVLVIKSKTGSGKSTALPVGIFRILRSEMTHPQVRFRGPGVICTQPRVLTAIELTRAVASIYPDMVLGMTVGYQTGPIKNLPASGLIYSTAGVLASQLRHQEDTEIMEKYRFIIVDEAHERSVDMDMTLMLLKNFYQRNETNPRLPFLLLASATIDQLRFAEYFGVGAANTIEVEGRPYTIKIHWLTHGTNNYPIEAAVVAMNIHEKKKDPPGKGDILIFVPGMSEALAVIEKVRTLSFRSASPVLALNLNSEVVKSQSGDYTLVFEDPEKLPPVEGKIPTRRIIVSTIVAETGITISTLRYVIDCGWNRAVEVYPTLRAGGLITRPVAQSRVTQRQGRVGRLFPGDFYPLYTEATFRQLDTNQLPEIITSGIEDVYLAIIRTQQKQKIHFGQNPEFRVEDIALLDPPTPESFLQANATAIALGFVGASPQSHGLTPLGLLASIFVRTPMTGIRVLLAGYIWKAAASDLITAVAMFGSQLDDLYDKKSKKDNPEVSALQAALPSQSHDVKHIIADQFVGAILLFEMFSRQLDSSRGDLRAMVAWCKPLKLKFEAFKKIAQKRDIIIEEMFTAGLNPFRADNSRLSELSADKFTDGFTRVKRCLYDGLRGNCLQYQLPDSGLDPDYVSSSGLRVRVPDFLSRTPPNWIITDTIRLVKRTNGAYSVTTNLVSVLDNYVYPDQSFGLPRTFI